MAFVAWGTALPPHSQGSLTLTCCLSLQGGNADNMSKKNPVVNQDRVVCEVKRENIIGILIVGL